MAKWNRSTFLVSTKDNCEPRVHTVILELIRFTEQDADQIATASKNHLPAGSHCHK